MKGPKRFIKWIIIAGICYMLLSYHFIFVGKGVKLLKKTNLSMNYTFFSMKSKEPEKILDIDELREAGIGDILVSKGKISEAKLKKILRQYE